MRVQGEDVRVWEKGAGRAARATSAGLGGLLEWTPFLDESRETPPRDRAVAAGLPGGGQLHRKLDGLADWVICTLDLLEAAGLEGKDLAGHSIGGTLAAEAAAFSAREREEPAS